LHSRNGNLLTVKKWRRSGPSNSRCQPCGPLRNRAIQQKTRMRPARFCEFSFARNRRGHGYPSGPLARFRPTPAESGLQDYNWVVGTGDLRSPLTRTIPPETQFTREERTPEFGSLSIAVGDESEFQLRSHGPPLTDDQPTLAVGFHRDSNRNFRIRTRNKSVVLVGNR